MVIRFIIVLLISLLMPLCCLSQSRLSFSPDTTSGFPGDSLEISVTIIGVEDLFAFAADLLYPSEFLTIHSLNEANLLDEDGDIQTSFLYEEIEPGRILIALTRLDQARGGVNVDGQAALIHVICSPTTAGRFDMHLEEVGVMNSDLDELPVDVHSGQIVGYGPPQLSALPDTILMINTSITLNLSPFINDPDTPIEQLHWDLTGYQHVTASIDEIGMLRITAPSHECEDMLIVEVEDPQEFQDIDTLQVRVDAESSIQEYNTSTNADFSIYPNPSNGSVTCFVPPETTQMQIYTLTGQLLITRTLQPTAHSQSISISSPGFKTGSYFLILRQHNNVIHLKFTILN
ncbi:T9SS type A sorting domain-containing protein [bacterium]|nr:T9SS type A sorting domain-containing protein [bacterium]